MDPARDEVRRGLGRAVRGVLDGQVLDHGETAGAGRQDDEFGIRRCVQQRRRGLEEQQRRHGVDREVVCHLGRGRVARRSEVLGHARVGDHDVQVRDGVLRHERFDRHWRVRRRCAVNLHDDHPAVVAMWEVVQRVR